MFQGDRSSKSASSNSYFWENCQHSSSKTRQLFFHAPTAAAASCLGVLEYWGTVLQVPAGTSTDLDIIRTVERRLYTFTVQVHSTLVLVVVDIICIVCFEIQYTVCIIIERLLHCTGTPVCCILSTQYCVYVLCRIIQVPGTVSCKLHVLRTLQLCCTGTGVDRLRY